MFKTILLVIVALVVLGIIAVLAIAATRPDTFRVTRATTIKAPAEKIFPFINDFSKWGEWSPYEKKDPAMKRTYSGPMSGIGAHYAWESDKGVGKGSMDITDAVTPGKVALNLDFEKPVSAHNTVLFTLEPQGDATLVTWTMEGPVPYPFKIVHMFMNMDKMVGGDFEAGLADLKIAAER
jgi:hypothetical protein